MTQEQIRNYVRAAIYIRTAADNAEAAAEQHKECMQYLERKGYFFVKEYADINTSGLNNTRSALDAMTIDAHLGEFDKIVVFSMSRISRSPMECITYCHDLKESCGISIEFVEGSVLLQ